MDPKDELLYVKATAFDKITALEAQIAQANHAFATVLTAADVETVEALLELLKKDED